MPDSKTEIDNLDPDFPFHVSDVLYEISSFNIPDLYQLIFLKNGKIKYHISPKVYIIPENYILFVPPGIGTAVSQSDDIEAIQIIFGKKFLYSVIISGFDENALKQFNIINPDNDSNSELVYINLHNGNFDKIFNLVNILMREYTLKDFGYKSMLQVKFMELLLNIYRVNPELERERELAYIPPKNINEIIDYINEHYSDPITLDEIAEFSGHNASYLSRLFREKTGTMLFEYINRIRIQKSCILLKNTSMPIIEIAFSVGYNNISYFNRNFRKIMMKSPRSYRDYARK